jgi:hypothetical protein
MAASRNRGVKKAKLRDYSHIQLTKEEQDQVSEVAHSIEQNPMVTAILGAVLVEHELDSLIRPKFKKADDDTWRALQEEQGPLRSFSAKISIGLAFNIYKPKIKADLDIVRIIRNAFAHSRKLLDFGDPLIIRELMGSHLLPMQFKKSLQAKPDETIAKAAFIVLCLKIQVTFMRIGSRRLRSKNSRLKRELAKSPLRNALLGNIPSSPLGLPLSSLQSLMIPTGGPKLPTLSSLVGHIENPNPEAPQGYANALQPFLEGATSRSTPTPLVLREAGKKK